MVMLGEILGQKIEEKYCILPRGNIFGPIFLKFWQNVCFDDILDKFWKWVRFGRKLGHQVKS